MHFRYIGITQPCLCMAQVGVKIFTVSFYFILVIVLNTLFTPEIANQKWTEIDNFWFYDVNDCNFVFKASRSLDLFFRQKQLGVISVKKSLYLNKFGSIF